MKNSWWNSWPAYVKYDTIDEIRHPNLWAPALSDSLTGVEKLKRDEYILYGPEEALLFSPTRAVFRVGMELYTALLKIVDRK